MESIAAHSHQDVTVLSSLPRPASFRGDWVWLAPDDQEPYPRDVTAGGTLHWAPRHDPGLARRSAQILAWLADARPALVVIDVSVEVALLVRLAGTPVVVAAMRGDRSDRPHATAYDLADVLVAPWPEESPNRGRGTGSTRRSTSAASPGSTGGPAASRPPGARRPGAPAVG